MGGVAAIDPRGALSVQKVMPRLTYAYELVTPFQAELSRTLQLAVASARLKLRTYI